MRNLSINLVEQQINRLGVLIANNASVLVNHNLLNLNPDFDHIHLLKQLEANREQLIIVKDDLETVMKMEALKV